MDIVRIVDMNGNVLDMVKMSYDISTHVVKRTISEVVITPDHGDTRDTAEMRKSKKRLREDGHYKCLVCGGTDDLQVHHHGCEYSLEGICDFELLKEYCETHDIYGYGKLMKNIPITSIDDIRNCMVLDQKHHTGVDHATGGTGTGIHQMTGPIFNIQMIAKKGYMPIPQDGQSIADVQEALKDAGNDTKS